MNSKQQYRTLIIITIILIVGTIGLTLFSLFTVIVYTRAYLGKWVLVIGNIIYIVEIPTTSEIAYMWGLQVGLSVIAIVSLKKELQLGRELFN